MLHLFQGFGIELEYMLVADPSMDIKGVSDMLLIDEQGELQEEIAKGAFCWSNELALHVIEIKTNGPAQDFYRTAQGFQAQIGELNRLLAPSQLRLLPTGMHPWMAPETETVIWPHHQNDIYNAYHELFDCHTHGWSNVQSMHLNLPFYNEKEFRLLHAAVRLILPLMPVLAASSPVVGGVLQKWDDMRLHYYFHSQKKIPSIAGDIIPEAVFSYKDYQEQILKPAYEAVALKGMGQVLREEWLNSRGAIARFDRQTIELRLPDMQETVWADMAIGAFFYYLCQALAGEQWITSSAQEKVGTQNLVSLLWATAEESSGTILEDRGYLDFFAFPDRGKVRAAEFMQYLLEKLLSLFPALVEFEAPLRLICREGSLSKRIRKRAAEDQGREGLRRLYQELGQCLEDGRQLSM